MKAFFEQVRVSDGCSWTVFDRRLEAFPFEWHYHPEFELTLTLNSRGQRYIGDHIGSYDHEDLVLIGPNLPHTWCSRERIRQADPHRAVVLWFQPRLAQDLIARWPEFASIQRLLRHAGGGLAFDGPTRKHAAQMVMKLLDQQPRERLITLLSILAELADSDACQTLSSASLTDPARPGEDRTPVDSVLSHIHAHYRETITMEDLASRACVSPSTLHRLFKRHARMPVTSYIAQLRLGQACSLIINTAKPITIIAEEVGYRNYANFERQFRKFKRVTPREFRKAFQPDA